jgi:hypothetical protein
MEAVTSSETFSAEVKFAFITIYIHLPYAFMAWCFIKGRDNFAFFRYRPRGAGIAQSV